MNLAEQVLRLLDERGAMGPTEVAAELGSTRGYVQQVLLTLKNLGKVTQDGLPHGKYAITKMMAVEEGEFEIQIEGTLRVSVRRIQQ